MKLSDQIYYYHILYPPTSLMKIHRLSLCDTREGERDVSEATRSSNTREREARHSTTALAITDRTWDQAVNDIYRLDLALLNKMFPVLYSSAEKGWASCCCRSGG